MQAGKEVGLNLSPDDGDVQNQSSSNAKAVKNVGCENSENACNNVIGLQNKHLRADSNPEDENVQNLFNTNAKVAKKIVGSVC